jgi:hypothetical protein
MGEKPAVVRALGALIVIVFLAGVVGAATQGTGPGGDGDALELVMAAADSTERARTGRFEMTMQMQSMGGVEFGATGQFDEDAGAVSITFTMPDLPTGAPFPAGGFGAVKVDGALYLQLPGLTAPDGSPGWAHFEGPGVTGTTAAPGGGVPLDPGSMLDSLRAVGEVEVVGHEELRGVAVTRYRAVLDNSGSAAGDGDPSSPLPSAVTGDVEIDMEVEAWIDHQGVAHRLEQRSTVHSDGEDRLTTSMRMDLLDLGQPVEITVPPAELIVATEHVATPEEMAAAVQRVVFGTLPGFSTIAEAMPD